MSPSFMDSIDTTKNHVTRMMLFDKIKTGENFYSPAEIINIYVSNKNENDFMNRLLKK